jgi:hypothetical protein
MAGNALPVLRLRRSVASPSRSTAVRGIGQVVIGRQPGESCAPIDPRLVSVMADR